MMVRARVVREGGKRGVEAQIVVFEAGTGWPVVLACSGLESMFAMISWCCYIFLGWFNGVVVVVWLCG